MNRDTPLPEVAHILSTKTATVLMNLPPEIQEFALRSVRHTLTNWEESDVCLDPITLETVLHDFVLTTVSLRIQIAALDLILSAMED